MAKQTSHSNFMEGKEAICAQLEQELRKTKDLTKILQNPKHKNNISYFLFFSPDKLSKATTQDKLIKLVVETFDKQINSFAELRDERQEKLAENLKSKENMLKGATVKGQEALLKDRNIPIVSALEISKYITRIPKILNDVVLISNYYKKSVMAADKNSFLDEMEYFNREAYQAPEYLTKEEVQQVEDILLKAKSWCEFNYLTIRNEKIGLNNQILGFKKKKGGEVDNIWNTVFLPMMTDILHMCGLNSHKIAVLLTQVAELCDIKLKRYIKVKQAKIRIQKYNPGLYAKIKKHLKETF